MKYNRKFWLSMFMLLSVGLVISTVFAPVVQARDVEAKLFEEVTAPVKEATPIRAAYSPEAYAAVWGISPDVLVNCDPNGTVLTGANLGNKMGYHRLQSGACQQQAALDKQAATAGNGSCSGASGVAGHGCGYSGVSGEGNQLKIYGFTSEVRYVYLQCGKKVAEVGPPSCSCGSGYYTYTYQRPKTVYITLPCCR